MIGSLSSCFFPLSAYSLASLFFQQGPPPLAEEASDQRHREELDVSGLDFPWKKKSTDGLEDRASQDALSSRW